MAFEYYEILGVSKDASEEELKRGYYRSIKKNHPEKNPEGYQRVVTAYETLQDPKARAQYDALQENGGEIEKLLVSVATHEERSEWSKAIQVLKRVVLLAPSLEAVQNRLGLAFIYSEQYPEAVKVFEKLTESACTIPLYWRHMGIALRLRASDFEEGSTNRGKMVTRAVQAFEAAHNLEPLNLKDFLEIAECHLKGSNYQLARSWAERAVSDTLDLTSLEALLFLARVNIFEGKTSGVDQVARRLCRLTPTDNEDLRTLVAERLAQLAHEVWEAGKKNQAEDLFRPAAILLNHATSLAPGNGQLKEFSVLLNYVADALDDFPRFKDDSSINEGLSNYGRYFLAQAIGHDVESWDWSYKDAIEQLRDLNDHQVLSALRTFQNKYPAIYWLGDTLLKEIEQRIVAADKEAAAKKEQMRLATERRRQEERQATERRRQQELQQAEERRKQKALQELKNRRRRDEEEERHRQAVARETRLRIERQQQRRIWWKRYGWLVVVGSAAALYLLAPVVKKEYLRQQAEQAERLARIEAEEQQRIAEENAALYRRLKEEQKEKQKEAQALADRVRNSGLNVKKQVVLDTQTGLTWMRDNPISERKMTWNQAMEEARTMNYAGFSDWRLPTREELEQMAARGGARPGEFFGKVGFPYVGDYFFWTSTEEYLTAWAVRMYDGKTDFGSKESMIHVWLVRGGSAPAPAEAAQPETTLVVAHEEAPVNATAELVLSSGEARQMVDRFLRAADSHDLGEIMSFYADKVNYFGWGTVAKSEVRKDKASHFKRWRENRSDLNSSVTVGEVPGSPERKSVSFKFNFYADNDKKAVNGVAANTWILQKIGDSLKIVDEKQSILQRDIQNH